MPERLYPPGFAVFSKKHNKIPGKVNTPQETKKAPRMPQHLTLELLHQFKVKRLSALTMNC